MFRPPVQVRKKRLDERYEIGDDGLIYSDGLPLEPIHGVYVKLHGELKKVSYLVARAWVPNVDDRPFVRHLNGDATDNRAVNLQWCETEETRKRGPKPQTRYCSAWNLDGDRVGIYPNPVEAAIALGVNEKSVRRALAGKQRTAGGYIWRWGA